MDGSWQWRRESEAQPLDPREQLLLSEKLYLFLAAMSY